jgi:lysozyme
MKISKQGRFEIASHEAVVRSAYLDKVDVWTIGIGHTAAAGKPDPSKMDPVKRYKYRYLGDMFVNDLKKYEDRVNRAVKVPLKQHEFDALVSFDYNTGKIFSATATKWLNEGKSKRLVGAALMWWVKGTVDGKKVTLPGLQNRRMKEYSLFVKGKYSNKGRMLEYQTNGRGRLIMSSAEPIRIKKLL